MAPVKAPGAEAVGAEDAAGPVVTRVLKDQILHLTKRKHDMFVSNHGMRAQELEVARKTRTAVKTRDEYWAVKDLPPPPGMMQGPSRNGMMPSSTLPGISPGTPRPALAQS